MVICVTASTTPVFDPSWLKPGAHVNTVGPRAQGKSELDPSIAGESGSSPPTRSANSGVMPPRISWPIPPGWRPWLNWGIWWWEAHGRQSPDDMTLFCTAGLSGTEVAVASEALRRAGHREVL